MSHDTQLIEMAENAAAPILLKHGIAMWFHMGEIETSVRRLPPETRCRDARQARAPVVELLGRDQAEFAI
jgi:hypothetical protein